MVVEGKALVPIRAAGSAVRPALLADLETGLGMSWLEAIYHLMIGASAKT
jgi:hypothetical protein